MCQSAWQHHAVFTGVVTDIASPGPRTFAPGQPRPTGRFPQKQVSMKITRALTGLDASAKEITIETGLGGGDCGYGFERGVEYIVYAFKQPNGQLSTGICSPTRPVSSAAEDLKYFSQLADADRSGEIRVTVFNPHRSWNRGPGSVPGVAGLADARVTIEGQGLRKTAMTNRNGAYVFGGLPPGDYRVTATLDGYTMEEGNAPASVHGKGCAAVPVALQLDRIVTGRILTRDGLPAAGVTVEAVPTRPRHENELPFPVDSGTTDANGRYELRRLTTGEYYLGISLGRSPTEENPYTRWFYPGTEDPQGAALIHVADRPERQSFEMTVPARQKPRLIEGLVLWPDGRAVANAQVFLEDPRWPWQVSTVAVNTDSAGRFAAKALDGTKYRVQAVAVANGSYSAEPVAVEPGESAARVTLVLTRKGYSPAEQVGKGLDAWRSGRGLR